MKTITIKQPDNWHGHLRAPDDPRFALLTYFLGAFRRMVVMPNLRKEKRIFTGGQAMAYYQSIKDQAAELGYPDFEPVMTIYITHQTTPAMIFAAKEMGVRAGKIYPAAGTTESDDGIVDYNDQNFQAVLRAMAECGMLCLIHCEVPDQKVDPQKREQRFMPILLKIVERHPNLRIVVEHISSVEAVVTVLSMDDNVAATVTAHHLFLTVGDLDNPHNCCMPRAKTEADRATLRQVVLMGSKKFFYGGDDAPHLRAMKEDLPDGKGPAHGVWCGHLAIPILAGFFDSFGDINKLGPFVSHFGADFYGMPRNEGELTLVKRELQIPGEFSGVVPFWAGKTIDWQFQTDSG